MKFRIRDFLLAACLAVMALPSCGISPKSRESAFLNRGDVFVKKSDYPRALLEFRNAEDAMPKDAEPIYRIGLVYIQTGDLQRAAGAFQRAIVLNPKHIGAQLKLAELMTTIGDQQVIEQAASKLQGILRSSPNEPEALASLALADWKLGKPEEASGLLQEALEKFPTNLQSSVTLARMKINQKDWGGAEQVLNKAVSSAPQSPDAAVALGSFYLLVGRPDSAEAEFRRALQLDPKDGAAMMSLAGLLMKASRLDEAEKIYKQLSTRPEKTYRPVHAVFLYETGKREASLSEFEALARTDPNDREARNRLVAVYFATNRSSDAERVVAAALKRSPRDTDALLQRAVLRLQSGKADDAERDLATVLHFNPDSATAHFVLAKVYGAKGLRPNRIEELQQALRFNPSLLPARLALETAFLSAKQSRAALDVMDQAPEAQKPELLWILARNWALLSLGKLQEARPEIDRALQRARPFEAVFQDAALRLLLRDYAGARTSLNELLKRGITDLSVLEMLMLTYAAQRTSSEGVTRLQEIATAQPKSAPAQYLLGKLYRNAGNLGAARQAFVNAKIADPQFTESDLALADLDRREGRNDSALQRLKAVVTVDPSNVPALVQLARAEHVSGDSAAEMQTYRSILNADRSNPIALNNLAYVLANSNPDEALKYVQQAVEAAPEDASIQDTIGWIYYRKGLYSAAAGYLKRAVDKEPNPRRQFHLGMSYLKVGDQRGRKIVLDAMQKDPSLAVTEKGW